MSGFGEGEFFRTVLEGLRTAVYVVNREGKTLFWNDGAERITGHLRQDVVGRVCGDNFLGETDSDNNDLSGALAPLKRQGVMILQEFRILRKHGTLVRRIAVGLERHQSFLTRPAEQFVHHLHRLEVLRFSVLRAAEHAGDAPGDAFQNVERIGNEHRADGRPANVIVGAAQSFQETISVSDWDRRHTRLATYGCLDQASGVLNHGMVQAHLRENLGMFADHPIPFSILCIEIAQLDKIQARDGPGAIAAVRKINSWRS